MRPTTRTAPPPSQRARTAAPVCAARCSVGTRSLDEAAVGEEDGSNWYATAAAAAATRSTPATRRLRVRIGRVVAWASLLWGTLPRLPTGCCQGVSLFRYAG